MFNRKKGGEQNELPLGYEIDESDPDNPALKDQNGEVIGRYSEKVDRSTLVRDAIRHASQPKKQ